MTVYADLNTLTIIEQDVLRTVNSCKTPLYRHLFIAMFSESLFTVEDYKRT